MFLNYSFRRKINRRWPPGSFYKHFMISKLSQARACKYLRWRFCMTTPMQLPERSLKLVPGQRREAVSHSLHHQQGNCSSRAVPCCLVSVTIPTVLSGEREHQTGNTVFWILTLRKTENKLRTVKHWHCTGAKKRQRDPSTPKHRRGRSSVHSYTIKIYFVFHQDLGDSFSASYALGYFPFNSFRLPSEASFLLSEPTNRQLLGPTINRERPSLAGITFQKKPVYQHIPIKISKQALLCQQLYSELNNLCELEADLSTPDRQKCFWRSLIRSGTAAKCPRTQTVSRQLLKGASQPSSVYKTDVLYVQLVARTRGKRCYLSLSVCWGTPRRTGQLQDKHHPCFSLHFDPLVLIHEDTRCHLLTSPYHHW